MSPRLLLDVMCGGLASYLWMCGHDTVYALDREVEDDDRLLAARTDTAVLLEKTDTESHTIGQKAVTHRDCCDSVPLWR